MKSGIYCIKNIVNNKLYVGSSINLYNRKIHHFSDLRCNRHNNYYLQNAFNKYGEDNFEFLIIEYNEKDLIKREQYWINLLQSVNRNKGYNLSPFADRPSPWINKKHHSLETIEKMRKIKQGKIFTNEHKLNLSISHRGKKLSEETKRKIGESSGKNISIDGRRKISDVHKGKQRTDETKKKISNTLKGIKFSKERKIKIKEGLIKSWKKKKEMMDLKK